MMGLLFDVILGLFLSLLIQIRFALGKLLASERNKQSKVIVGIFATIKYSTSMICKYQQERNYCRMWYSTFLFHFVNESRNLLFAPLM